MYVVHIALIDSVDLRGLVSDKYPCWKRFQTTDECSSNHSICCSIPHNETCFISIVRELLGYLASIHQQSEQIWFSMNWANCHTYWSNWRTNVKHWTSKYVPERHPAHFRNWIRVSPGPRMPKRPGSESWARSVQESSHINCIFNSGITKRHWFQAVWEILIKVLHTHGVMHGDGE